MNHTPIQIKAQVFLTVCLGISAILLSSAIFLFSIQRLTARETPTFEMLPENVTNGKYLMDLEMIETTDGKVEERVLIWDMETGQSKVYFLNYQGNYAPIRGKLPANPLK